VNSSDSASSSPSLSYKKEIQVFFKMLGSLQRLNGF